MGNLHHYCNEDLEPLGPGEWTPWTSLPHYSRPRIPFGRFMLTNPTNDAFTCTQAFGAGSYRHCDVHTGADWAPRYGDLEIVPAMSMWFSAYATGNWIGEGYVRMMHRVGSGYNGGYGPCCVLAHCNPALGWMVETAYSHLRNVAEPPKRWYRGEWRSSGYMPDDETIAYLCQGTGSQCGLTTGAHLHFELRVVVADDYEIRERCHRQKGGGWRCTYSGRAYYRNPLIGDMYTDCNHYVDPYSPGRYVVSYLSGSCS